MNNKFNSIGDIVAENMQQIVESDSHHKMFTEPTTQIKLASDKCCNCDKCDSGCPCHGKCGKGCTVCKSDEASADDGITAEAVQRIVNNLTHLSMVLDNLGLSRSSGKTLLALDNLISEIALRKFAGPLTEIEVVDEPMSDVEFDKELPELGTLEDYLDIDDSNDISDTLRTELENLSSNHPDLIDTIGDIDSFDNPYSEYGAETLFNPNIEPGTEYDPDLLAGDDDGTNQYSTDLIPNANLYYGVTDYPRHDTLPSRSDTLIDDLGSVVAELDSWIAKRAAEAEEEEKDAEAQEEEDFEDE